MKKFFEMLSRPLLDKGGLTVVEALVVLLIVMTVAFMAIGPAFALTGKVTGTGADITVKVGFKPSHVIATNIINGHTMEWFAGMDADSAIKLTNATDGTALSVIAYNGVAMYNGTYGSSGQIQNSPGFILGADPQINVIANDIVWEAER